MEPLPPTTKSWFSALSPEAQQIIDTTLDTVLEDVASIVDHEELAAAIEGGILGVIAGVEDTQTFQNTIETELALASIEEPERAQVRAILKHALEPLRRGELTEAELPDTPPEGAPSPTDVLSTIKSRLTETKSLPQRPADSGGTKSLDPYREPLK